MNASRREVLQIAVVAAATALLETTSRALGSNDEPLIDTNLSLGAWPFRRVPLATTSAVVDKLRAHGTKQAWAGSFEALLHKDISAVNARLAEECRQHGGDLLVPMGAINPLLPDWKEDLRRCVEIHRMPGIRLHPNYHGYKLSDEAFASVLQEADKRKLLVQIAVIMEDERTIHRLVNVPATELEPLPAVMKMFPNIRLQLLNAFRKLRTRDAATLAADGVHFEISMLEGVIGIEKLLEQLPLTSVCFGSHAPVFYFESAVLKLQESMLAGIQRRAICSGNATRLLQPE